MDPVQMVGGASGLERIAEALRREGHSIDAIYLIKLLRDGKSEDWVIRIVSPEPAFDVAFKFFALQSDGRLPPIGERVRIEVVAADDPETSPILSYARRFNRLPLEINTVVLNGVLVDYALVAELPKAGAAAA